MPRSSELSAVTPRLPEPMSSRFLTKQVINGTLMWTSCLPAPIPLTADGLSVLPPPVVNK